MPIAKEDQEEDQYEDFGGKEDVLIVRVVRAKAVKKIAIAANDCTRTPLSFAIGNHGRGVDRSVSLGSR